MVISYYESSIDQLKESSVETWQPILIPISLDLLAKNVAQLLLFLNGGTTNFVKNVEA